MKYKVMYTAGAKKDLRNIFRYISEELLAPENAAGQTDRIMAAIRKLDTMPNRKGEGNQRASVVTDTQKEAINLGREISRNQRGELFIHGVDGKIRARDSHGNESVSTKRVGNERKMIKMLFAEKVSFL